MSMHKICAAVFISILFNMVSSCAAFGCANTVKKGSGISFHRFPNVMSQNYWKKPGKTTYGKTLNATYMYTYIQYMYTYAHMPYLTPKCFNKIP